MVEFTGGQKKTIAAGITILSLVVVMSFVALVAWGAIKLFAFAAPALVPVIMGFFLALFFRPYYRWWRGLVRNPTLALIVMLLTVLMPIGVLLWHAGAILIDQVSNLIDQGPAMVKAVIVWFSNTCPKLHSLLGKVGIPYDSIGDLYQTYGATALKAGSGALKCFSGIIKVLLAMIFFVFFLTSKERKGGEIVAHMPFLKDDTKFFLAEQIDAFVEILVSFFQRQMVICLIEGLMYGCGFWLVGLPYGFVIGFVLGVLNLIPLFGSIVCLPLALPIAYFATGGSSTRLLLVLGVWALGQFLDGYLITPRIQGNKTGLGYAGVIFSFFFWATVLGPLMGMLLAIPLSAFCVVLWRAVKSRYIKPVI